MGRKRTPGLYKRGEFWHIDKRVFGRRICESTETSFLEEAEKCLAKRIENLRQVVIYGERSRRKFREAATKFLMENRHKASIFDDAMHLKKLDSFIGDLNLEQVHMGTLQPFIKARLEDNLKAKSINLALGVVRHILNLAASEWLDTNGLTWLQTAPKIKMLPLNDARSPYPLSWDEQEKLFSELPPHLQKMALFKVNTGCREQEVCQLQWEWETKIPDLGTSVFIVPSKLVKNREDRLVILNNTAQAIIEEVRSIHPKYVFTYRGHPVTKINNSAWKRARKKVGLSQIRVHDLKHTFGRRLRAAGVGFEDRQDLLGHKSGKITTHYSAAEIGNLIAAANKVCKASQGSNGPTFMLLKQVSLLPARVNLGARLLVKSQDYASTGA
jgi:integrase